MRFRPSSNYLRINIRLSQYHFVIKLSSIQLSLHLCQKSQFSPLVWVDFYTLTQWHKLANDFLIILLASVVWFTFSFFIFIIYVFSFFPLILLPRNRSVSSISFLPVWVHFYSVTQWHKRVNNIDLLPFSHCRICIWFSHVYNLCFSLLYWNSLDNSR